ncbi:helix-turn-helix domain-containing protein [Aureibacillus halotolerans]|uniref:AraC-like DNA-binding protein n=1 Tax=Aureibacillus halotolerans TaxID=1508390 RepID=A0A4R6U565_9BACI|nr:AraC family transcriptional regulator [Aureibacillus halotolerans]TDQ40662.1 AraC-like DNA-binding protein [Aureibacillus halotolerans]
MKEGAALYSHSDGFVKIPQGFWESLKSLGLHHHEVICKAKLPISLTEEEPLVLKRSHYLAIWKVYEEFIGDTSQAIIQMVDAYKISKYPPSFMAIYHASTYREAIKKMVKYKKLCPPENLTFQEKGNKSYIDLGHVNDENIPPVLIGSTLASILEVGRRGTGLKMNAMQLEVTFSLDNSQILESFFGCKVKTRSLYNRLTLKRSDLDHSFASSNEEVLSMLTPTLDKMLSEHLNSKTLTEHVKEMLRNNLSNENTSIELISKKMGTGSRTLQRKLNDEGTNFKQLFMQVRREKSLDYLATTSLSIKEIAYLVGYTDQNSFYRAFRLWENDTPTNWRRDSNCSLNHVSREVL